MSGESKSESANSKVLQGHHGVVSSVSFSVDGKLIVSGSEDRTLRVWNAVSGKRVLEPLEGHTDWVTSVSFSGDGKLIVSGSDDKTVRVWNAVSGECLHILRGHTNYVTSVSFSGDGNLIVSGSRDRTVRVWNLLAYQWRELKRELKVVYYLSIAKNNPLAMDIAKANYYVESMLNLKKRAAGIGFELDNYDNIYKMFIGVSEKKIEDDTDEKKDDTQETSTKRQKTKLVDSILRLRF